MRTEIRRVVRRIAVAAATTTTVLASVSMIAPTAAQADNAGPTCRNGADQADFYTSAGFNRTFRPGGLCLTSLGDWRTVFQTDGNLVTYPPSGGAAVWSSRTNGKGANALVLQADGNMVIYNGGYALWSTHTAGNVGPNGNFLKQTNSSALNLYKVDARGNAIKIW